MGSESSVVTLGDLWRAVSRFRRRAILVALLIAGLAFASLYVWPRTYVSEAKLFVKIGKDTATIDPITSAMGQAINVLESRQTEINSILELMRSRELADRVVKQLGPAAVMEGEIPDDKTATPKQLSAAAKMAQRAQAWIGKVTSYLPSDPIGDEEQAALHLMGNMRIGSTRSSGIITVGYESKSPLAAQLVLQAFLENFARLHLEVQKSRGSLKFFESAVAESAERVRAESDQLRAAKAEIGAASIDGRRKLLEDELSAVRLALVQAEGQLSELTSKISALSGRLELIPERVVAQETNGIGNAGVEQMRDRLYQLEIQETEASATLTPDHPRMIALKQAKAESAKVLNATNDERKHVTRSLNATHQSLELALLTEQSAREALLAKVAKLREQEQTCLGEIKAFGQAEIRLQELQRKLQVAETTFLTHSSRLEQTRVNEALESQQITNVNTVQPPSLSNKPESPKKPLVLGLGTLLGLFAGVSVAVFAQASDRSLRTREEIEGSLAVPVLVQVPRSQWLATRWR